MEILGPSGYKRPHPQAQISPQAGHPATTPEESAGPAQEGASLRPRAAGLSNTAIATRQRLHHQPSALLLCPRWSPAPRQGPGLSRGWSVEAQRGQGPRGCTLGGGRRLLCPHGAGLKRGPQQGMWALTSESCLSALAAGSCSLTSASRPCGDHRSGVEGHRALGVRRGASIQLTSWGAGGREGAAARPARWR